MVRKTTPSFPKTIHHKLLRQIVYQCKHDGFVEIGEYFAKAFDSPTEPVTMMFWKDTQVREPSQFLSTEMAEMCS